MPTLGDLEEHLGRSLTAVEVSRAESALRYVVAVGSSAAGSDLVEPLTDAVRAVLSTAALRVFHNPQGFQRETVGAWSGERAVTGTFTAEERAVLRRAGGSRVTSVALESERFPYDYDCSEQVL